MDPSVVDARLPLRRFVLFFADDASSAAQELFERLERLGFTGRLYNDASLLALETDEYRRTELAVRNSQYWFVYATDSFFAEQQCGFLKQHCGELLACTALSRNKRWANRLIPIYCKPKAQYVRLAWGFGSLSGLLCHDRHFEAALTGFLKSDIAESMWQELQEQWRLAQLTVRAEEERRKQLELELQMKELALAAAESETGGSGGGGASRGVVAAGTGAHSGAAQCGHTCRPLVAASVHGPPPVIYNISVTAHQSTLQVGDSNAMHYCASSMLSHLNPTSKIDDAIDGSLSITTAEGFSNGKADGNEDEATSPICNQAGTAAHLLSDQPDGQPISVVDSSRPQLESGSSQMPSLDARPALGAVSVLPNSITLSE